MTLSEKSDYRRAWWKVIAADLVAVAVITAATRLTRWPPLVGLLGVPVGAAVCWRWAP